MCVHGGMFFPKHRLPFHVRVTFNVFSDRIQCIHRKVCKRNIVQPNFNKNVNYIEMFEHQVYLYYGHSNRKEASTVISEAIDSSVMQIFLTEKETVLFTYHGSFCLRNKVFCFLDFLCGLVIRIILIKSVCEFILALQYDYMKTNNISICNTSYM